MSGHLLFWRMAVVAAAMAMASPAPAQIGPDDCAPTTLDDLQEQVDETPLQAEPHPEKTQPPRRPPLAPFFDGPDWGRVTDGQGPDPGRILTEALEELEETRTPPEGCLARNPLGDTVYIRSPGAFPGIPEQDQRILVAAEIARTVSVALTILDELGERTADNLTRYRVDLEILLRLMRTPDDLSRETFEERLRSAWASVARVPTLDPALLVRAEADLHFAEGWACMRWDDSEACLVHFDAAIEADPFYAAARQARIELLDVAIQRLSSAAAPLAVCERLQSQIILDIAQVLSGVTEPGSKVQVALALDAAAGPTNPVLLLAAVFAYREGGALVLADTAEAELSVFLQTEHPCNAVIQEAVDDIF